MKHTVKIGDIYFRTQFSQKDSSICKVVRFTEYTNGTTHTPMAVLRQYFPFSDIEPNECWVAVGCLEYDKAGYKRVDFESEIPMDRRVQ